MLVGGSSGGRFYFLRTSRLLSFFFFFFYIHMDDEKISHQNKNLLDLSISTLSIRRNFHYNIF